MKPTPDAEWNPDPQLLAAYFDGELEGRDDVADLRRKLDAWLEEHSEAIEECRQHQELQTLWADTAPPEPTAATWNALADQIEARRQEPVVVPSRKRAWLATGIVAASIAIGVGLVFGAVKLMAPGKLNVDPIAVNPKDQPQPEDVEVFAVATADEVIVRRIDGADTSLLAVGRMPVSGELKLVGIGEVRVNYVRPDPVDQTVATVLENGPMIWGRLASD